MSEFQADQLIATLQGIDKGLFWVCLWLFFISVDVGRHLNLLRRKRE